MQQIIEAICSICCSRDLGDLCWRGPLDSVCMPPLTQDKQQELGLRDGTERHQKEVPVPKPKPRVCPRSMQELEAKVHTPMLPLVFAKIGRPANTW